MQNQVKQINKEKQYIVFVLCRPPTYRHGAFPGVCLVDAPSNPSLEETDFAFASWCQLQIVVYLGVGTLFPLPRLSSGISSGWKLYRSYSCCHSVCEYISPVVSGRFFLMYQCLTQPYQTCFFLQ